MIEHDARDVGPPAGRADDARRARTRSSASSTTMQWDSGYSTQQRPGRRPLGYGLADSPAGQLAWILEKFWAWTDCDGHPENVLTRDEMLDNVMLYWLTRHGDLVGPHLLGELRPRLAARRVNVPTGFAVYPEGDRAAGPRVGRASSTRTSCTGASTTRAATSPHSRCPRRSSATCASASGSRDSRSERGRGDTDGPIHSRLHGSGPGRP